MSIHHFWGDLPENHPRSEAVAIDTETLGLRTSRDRLCLVQLSWGDGVTYLVQLPAPSQNPSSIRASTPAPRLSALLTDPSVTKIFHFARFDVAVLYQALGVLCAPIYCTKIASRFARTYTDRHGLKDVCRELLGIEISKSEQSSDWGAPQLSEDQKKYAARDVLYLHALRKKLDVMLAREGRLDLATACFDFLPHRSLLDCAGWEEDIFSHSV